MGRHDPPARAKGRVYARVFVAAFGTALRLFDACGGGCGKGGGGGGGGGEWGGDKRDPTKRPSAVSLKAYPMAYTAIASSDLIGSEKELSPEEVAFADKFLARDPPQNESVVCAPVHAPPTSPIPLLPPSRNLSLGAFSPSLLPFVKRATSIVRVLQQQMAQFCERTVRRREELMAALHPICSIIATTTNTDGKKKGSIWQTPSCAACTGAGVLVVADRGKRCVYQFSRTDEGAYALQFTIGDIVRKGCRRRNPWAIAVAGERIFCMRRAETMKNGVWTYRLCVANNVVAAIPEFDDTVCAFTSTGDWVALAACTTVDGTVRIAVIDGNGASCFCPDVVPVNVQNIPMLDRFDHETGCVAFDAAGNIVVSTGRLVRRYDFDTGCLRTSTNLKIRLLPAGLLVWQGDLVVVDCQLSCVVRFDITTGAVVSFVQAPSRLAGPVFELPGGEVVVLYACGSIAAVRWPATTGAALD